MTDPKLCKNCKHIRRNWITYLFVGDEFSKCGRPVNPDLVSGKTELKNYCSIERKYWYSIDACGPEGKYFEERKSKSFWDWLKEL